MADIKQERECIEAFLKWLNHDALNCEQCENDPPDFYLTPKTNPNLRYAVEIVRICDPQETKQYKKLFELSNKIKKKYANSIKNSFLDISLKNQPTEYFFKKKQQNIFLKHIGELLLTEKFPIETEAVYIEKYECLNKSGDCLCNYIIGGWVGDRAKNAQNRLKELTKCKNSKMMKISAKFPCILLIHDFYEVVPLRLLDIINYGKIFDNDKNIFKLIGIVYGTNFKKILYKNPQFKDFDYLLPSIKAT
ncbi:MAG: hypothetical protein NTW04_03630 [Elusimicrobia bacterium]|nr:hypothetical protein [Elusimicrobiota bacterium]